MTDIAKAPHDERQRAKWQAQARHIAAELKAVPDWGEREQVRPAIVFDDAVVTLKLETATIRNLSEQALADLIFNGVLDAQKAAPQAADAVQSAQETPAPTPAAAAERCVVNDTGEQCTNNAVGGLRLNLFPTAAVQKRYGKRVMLSLIMDLPICLQCMPRVTPSNVVTEEQWRGFQRIAQQRNSGILADRSQTEIALCPFNDPEYIALRAHMAKQHASNDSQPGQEGPQQGAGNGTT